MDQYLVFQLYGPLAAWADAAGVDTKPASDRPGKSAIVGLLSCALGWRRDDQEPIERLATSYQMATKVLTPGAPVIDYHTIQRPGSDRSYRSRRDELLNEGARVKTTLSWREYRCDAFVIVALRPVPGGTPSVEHLHDALQRPRGMLYLGRRACPPALPLHPQLIEAQGFRSALDEVSRESVIRALGLPKGAQWRLFEQSSAPQQYAWEGEAGDIEAQEVVARRDAVGNRARHLFDIRHEQVAYLSEDI